MLEYLFLLCSLFKKFKQENFFISPGFGNVIYDNYIFDIPRLFDICSLYAINNKELLSKMIGNIFKQQQAYTNDLRSAIKSIIDVSFKSSKVLMKRESLRVPRVLNLHSPSFFLHQKMKSQNKTISRSSFWEIFALLFRN